jgi:hypothetical protein
VVAIGREFTVSRYAAACAAVLSSRLFVAMCCYP